MLYYLYNKERYFSGSQDFPEGIRPENGTLTAPANEPNQKWMGNEWKNVPKRQKTLDELKQDKINEATKFYDNMINSTLSDVADFERTTWEPQRVEWIRYQDDVLANTPYCDALSASRGITKELLMTKIGNNILNGATVQGILHSKIDLVKAALTEEELRAITF